MAVKKQSYFAPIDSFHTRRIYPRGKKELNYTQNVSESTEASKRMSTRRWQSGHLGSPSCPLHYGITWNWRIGQYFGFALLNYENIAVLGQTSVEIFIKLRREFRARGSEPEKARRAKLVSANWSQTWPLGGASDWISVDVSDVLNFSTGLHFGFTSCQNVFKG